MQAISWRASIITSVIVLLIFVLFAKIFTVQNSPVSADFLVAHHNTLEYKVVNVGLEQDEIAAVSRTDGQQIVLIPNIQKAVGMRDPETLQLLAQPAKSQYIFFQEIMYPGGILAGENFNGGSDSAIQRGYLWRYDQLSNSFSKMSGINRLYSPEFFSGNQIFLSDDQQFAIIVSGKGDSLILADLNGDKYTVLGNSAAGQSFLDAAKNGQAQIQWLSPNTISCAIYDATGSGNKRVLLGVQTILIKR